MSPSDRRNRRPRLLRSRLHALADRPDAIVDDDSARVGLDARRLQVQLLDVRPAARGEQQPLELDLALHAALARADRLRIDEARRALVRVEAGRTKVLDPLRLRLAQRVLARLDPGEVDRRGADVDADPLGERVDPVRELGGDEVGLRRRAGGIRAAAAPQPVLDERRPRAILGRRLAGAVARGRAGADHDQGAVPAGVERVLFKTPNSRLWEREEFADDFVKLDGDAARGLVASGVRLVGIDYLSIGDEEAHHVLLEAGVVAVEGLDLRRVEPGEYLLVCAPLKLVGSDGAPARVLLLRD